MHTSIKHTQLKNKTKKLKAQRASYFRSRYAYFLVTMPIFGHLRLIRSYQFNSYKFSIEGEIILLDCLCLLPHIWIFTILLMFCGCFGVEFINRTKSFKIKHNGPIQFCVKSIIVLCVLRWRMIFNLSHDVFCASQIYNILELRHSLQKRLSQHFHDH